MRSDDAAGCHVAGTLRSAFPGAGVINAEDIIESYAFTIAGMECSNVLIIDAVEAPHAAGSLVFGKFSEIKASAVNFSTHKLSLALAVDIIERSGKKVYLLGIVPGSTEFGFEMGPAVTKSADIIIELLSECLNHNQKEYVYER
jgi:hydrogenase maturation protease